MINDRVRNTPLSIDARGTSVRVVVAADNYTVANLSLGINDREDYARLFAVAPQMLKLLGAISRMERSQDDTDDAETINSLIIEAKIIIDNL